VAKAISACSARGLQPRALLSEDDPELEQQEIDQLLARRGRVDCGIHAITVDTFRKLEDQRCRTYC
jgi:hypothetical protein